MIEAEADVSKGLQAFDIVGLPDSYPMFISVSIKKHTMFSTESLI